MVFVVMFISLLAPFHFLLCIGVMAFYVLVINHLSKLNVFASVFTSSTLPDVIRGSWIFLDLESDYKASKVKT